MKTQNLKIFSLTLLLCFFTISCAGVKHRIKKNNDFYSSLGTEAQQKIYKKEIDLGYSSKMVYLAWGKRDTESSETSEAGNSTAWVYYETESIPRHYWTREYDKSTKKWKRVRETEYEYFQYPKSYVIFKNDRVIKYGYYKRSWRYRDHKNPYSRYSGCGRGNFADGLLCAHRGGYL